jgi:hypothetical protein
MIIFNNISNPLRSPRPPERPATGQALPSPQRPTFTFIDGRYPGLETTRHWPLAANFTERLAVLRSELRALIRQPDEARAPGSADLPRKRKRR